MRYQQTNRLLWRLLTRYRLTYCVQEASCSHSAKREENEKPAHSFVERIKTKHSVLIDSLSEKITKRHLEYTKFSQKKKADVDKLVSYLSSSTVTTSARLVPIGSAVTGLCFGNSDLDMVLLPTNPDDRPDFLYEIHGNADFRHHFLHLLSQLVIRSLRKRGTGFAIKNLSIQSQLRVPLVIMQFENGLSMDIHIPDASYHAIRNSLLVKTYASLDIRLPQLCLWLRILFDALEIRNSKIGLLSSYYIILLAIHFLQSEQCLSPWPVLPVLCKTHSKFVSKDMDIDEAINRLHKPIHINWTSHNHLSIGELVIRFISYYSSFDTTKQAIFIERGMALKRRQELGNVRLQLIDPYSPITVCRSNIAAHAFSDAIRFSYKLINHGHMIDSFPEFNVESRLFRHKNRRSIWRQRADGRSRD